jgi:hypothetical protein
MEKHNNEIIRLLNKEIAGSTSIDHSAQVPPFEIRKYMFRVLRSSTYIHYYREIPNSGLKRFIKRLIRKAVKFCVEPPLQSISDYNYQVYVTLERMQRELDECKLEIQKQRSELDSYLSREKIK